MQWGCATKPSDASDLKAIGLGMRESACMSEGKWRLRCLLLLWRTWARVWPKRLPNVGSLLHAVPRGDLLLPKVLAQPKTHLRPRITPELSRTAARHGGVLNDSALSRAAKRSRLERIVRAHVVRTEMAQEATSALRLDAAARTTQRWRCRAKLMELGCATLLLCGLTLRVGQQSRNRRG